MIVNSSPENRLFVACIDSGGVLRSRTASEVLNTMGIPAGAYAARDVTQQTFKTEVPPHVAAIFMKYGYNVIGDPIVQIPKDIVDIATHFFVVCGLHELPAYLNPSDSRIYHHEVKDVNQIGDIPDYLRAMRDVAGALELFVSERAILG